jgi:hypothetical protein
VRAARARIGHQRSDQRKKIAKSRGNFLSLVRHLIGVGADAEARRQPVVHLVLESRGRRAGIRPLGVLLKLILFQWEKRQEKSGKCVDDTDLISYRFLFARRDCASVMMAYPAERKELRRCTTFHWQHVDTIISHMHWRAVVCRDRTTETPQRLKAHAAKSIPAHKSPTNLPDGINFHHVNGMLVLFLSVCGSPGRPWSRTSQFGR